MNRLRQPLVLIFVALPEVDDVTVDFFTKLVANHNQTGLLSLAKHRPATLILILPLLLQDHQPHKVMQAHAPTSHLNDC